MFSRIYRIVVRSFFWMAFLVPSSCLLAQVYETATPLDTKVIAVHAEIPDAPAPQIELALAEPQSGQPQNQQAPASTGAAGNSSSGQSNSSSQDSAQTSQPANAQEMQRQKAEQQLKEEEHQRIAGIVPSFNVTYHSDAISLTPAQKFRLEFRSMVDPYTFAISSIVADIGEAENVNPGFGWGPEGYTKRVAAAYADNVIGNTFGNAILPSLLHQDPRYFRLGHGTVRHRLFYAIATSFICKHDNTGKWEPNYSNVLGNMIGGEISNLYYPKGSRSNASETLVNGITVTFEGTFGATLQEFWPDISRRYLHQDPTHGLDAQGRAAQ